MQDYGARSGLAGRMTYHETSKAISGRRPEARQMSKTVLIVEDNELNMKLFHDLLDAHGYRTLQTRNGMEALELAREQRPDLILMDIQLPEVSGLEVTKWLKDDEALARHSGDRGDRVRHEGRRGAHPSGRLRGLHLQAHIDRHVSRHRAPASRRGMRPIGLACSEGA